VPYQSFARESTNNPCCQITQSGARLICWLIRLTSNVVRLPCSSSDVCISTGECLNGVFSWLEDAAEAAEVPQP